MATTAQGRGQHTGYLTWTLEKMADDINWTLGESTPISSRLRAISCLLQAPVTNIRTTYVSSRHKANTSAWGRGVGTEFHSPLPCSLCGSTFVYRWIAIGYIVESFWQIGHVPRTRTRADFYRTNDGWNGRKLLPGDVGCTATKFIGPSRRNSLW